jgi:hypothetical protein
MEIFDLSGFMCTITGELYCNTFPSICIYVGVAVAVTGRCAAFGKIHVKSPRYLHLGLKSSPLQILNKVIQFISQDIYQY